MKQNAVKLCSRKNTNVTNKYNPLRGHRLFYPNDSSSFPIMLKGEPIRAPPMSSRLLAVPSEWIVLFPYKKPFWV